MSELKTLLEQVGGRVTPRQDAYERLGRLRRRKQRTRRIQAGAVAFLVAAGGAIGALAAFHQPAAHPVGVGSGPSAEFHALWPEQVLADAQYAQDLVDAGQEAWRLDAAQVVSRFATQILGWTDPIPESRGCFGSDCPFDNTTQAFDVHRGCLTCPGVVVEVQRVPRSNDTGSALTAIWSVTRVAGAGIDLKVEPGATIGSGDAVVGPLASPDSGVIFAGYSYIGQCGALDSFAPVTVTGGQVEIRVATSSFEEHCGSGGSSVSGSSSAGGGPGLLAEPVDGYVFVARLPASVAEFNPLARGPKDTAEIDDLVAVPVRFVPAVASPTAKSSGPTGTPSEKPSGPTPVPSASSPPGVFQWCPDVKGSLPPDSNAPAEASDVALRFSKAYVSGDTLTARSMADGGAFDHAFWSVSGRADAITVRSSSSAATDTLVTYGCGSEAAARSYAVTLHDGTDSASLDFTLYLIQRRDGWKVWGSY